MPFNSTISTVAQRAAAKPGALQVLAAGAEHMGATAPSVVKKFPVIRGQKGFIDALRQ